MSGGVTSDGRQAPRPTRTAVMRFADEDAAGAAYAELTEWMEDCAD
jgi:hypothetical protein